MKGKSLSKKANNSIVGANNEPKKITKSPELEEAQQEAIAIAMGETEYQPEEKEYERNARAIGLTVVSGNHKSIAAEACIPRFHKANEEECVPGVYKGDAEGSFSAKVVEPYEFISISKLLSWSATGFTRLEIMDAQIIPIEEIETAIANYGIYTIDYKLVDSNQNQKEYRKLMEAISHFKEAWYDKRLRYLSPEEVSIIDYEYVMLCSGLIALDTFTLENTAISRSEHERETRVQEIPC